MAEGEERDESLQERVEQVFDEADAAEPWTISGVDPTSGELVSERVAREEVAPLLEREARQA